MIEKIKQAIFIAIIVAMAGTILGVMSYSVYVIWIKEDKSAELCRKNGLAYSYATHVSRNPDCYEVACYNYNNNTHVTLNWCDK